jgi:hypothetical protein
MSLQHHHDGITVLKSSKPCVTVQTSRFDYSWKLWKRISVWGPFLETTFLFCQFNAGEGDGGGMSGNQNSIMSNLP